MNTIKHVKPAGFVALKVICTLLICLAVVLPCRAAGPAGPRIGLTDTVYHQFRVILKELDATPVDLVTETSMQAYFNDISEFYSYTIKSYQPYDINVWRIYHWVADFDGPMATSGKQDTDTWVKTTLDGELWRWRWERRDAPKPLVLTSEDFLREFINLEAVEAAVQNIDGLLIGGGEGVNPRLYGNDKGIPPFRGYKTRDIIEIAFIWAALKHQKPILGICRGAQILAVALGSELTFDLPAVYDYEGLSDRHYHANEVEDAKGHDIVVLPGSTMAEILGLSGPGPHVINVNSYHTHAVLKPSPLISVQAYDYTNTENIERNIIEGFVHRDADRFVAGVQWHPERPMSETGERARLVFDPKRFFPRPHDKAIFDSFLTAAGKEPPAKEKKKDYFGIWSVLPAFVALILAIATRHVILSLVIGVFGGMIVYNGGNVFKGLVDFIELGPFAQLARESNARVIIIISIIGGFVYLVEQSGGMKSFARKITSFVDTPFKAQLSVWMAGLAIFFTDSGNSLILGPLFRPIFKSLRICREKLAFILDSTSSPVCVLIPVISWGIYIMSLVEQSFKPLGLTESPLSAFANVLPFQFYPLLAIVTVPIMAFIGKEYGPMARFQRQTLETEEEDAAEPELTEEQGVQAGARAVFLPLGTMLFVAFALFAYFYVALGSLPGKKIQTSLVIAYMSGAIVCAAILKLQKVYTVKQSFKLFIKGISRVVFIIIVLLLAWSMGDVCKLLKTGDFIARFFGDFLAPALLPAVVFVLGAVISLSTGSSWGTFALLMPIAIPVAHGIGAPLYVTIASVLSGGMFGDHASPISDTTILSSMSSGCEHADHVNTQLPYACVTGLSALITFLIAGFTGSIWCLLSGLVIHGVLLLSITRLFGIPAHSS